jgi:septum formation protein
LLRRAGIAFSVHVSGVDEDAMKSAHHGAPATLAMALAERKAVAVSAVRPGALVVGADQILVCEDEIFSKPANLGAAASQLQRLRGRPHSLVTAVCVVRDGAVLWRYIAEPRLTMRDVSDGFLQGYLAAAGQGVLASPGAYQLEALGVQLFEAIDGDFFTILGLPLLPLLGFLRRAGVVPA